MRLVERKLIELGKNTGDNRKAYIIWIVIYKYFNCYKPNPKEKKNIKE